MGYGLGVFLVVVGLVLALAVTDTINNIDLTLVGWIVAAGGAFVIVLTAVQLNARRRTSSTATTTHSDGTQTVSERRNDVDGSL